MRVQQPAALVPYPNMWPWTYQSQMAAQAMNAAAMGLHSAPGGQPLWAWMIYVRQCSLETLSFVNITQPVHFEHIQQLRCSIIMRLTVQVLWLS